MAGTVGAMTVGILGDISSLSKGMNKAVQDVGKFGDKCTAIGEKVSSVGKSMSLAITLPLVGFGVAAVKFASDAEEIGSKFDAVFKETAGAVTEWVNEYADSVGRSRTSMKEFAATFQDTFVPLGFAREEAAQLSQRLVELTVDLASFNNASEPETMKALQSAIVGNHETMRRFGVIINQTNLNQELLNMGISEGVKVATEAQKAQARLNIIIAGTADAQGDAIRTSGSFANIMKSVRAGLKDVGEEVGAILIPHLKILTDKIKSIITWWKDLDYTQKKLIITIVAITAAIGPLLFAIGKLISGIHLLTAAFTLVAAHPIVAATLAIGAAFGVLWLKCEAFREFWHDFWQFLKDDMEIFVNGIIGGVNWMINVINSAVNLINKLPFVNLGELSAVGIVDLSSVEATSERIAEQIVGATIQLQQSMERSLSNQTTALATDIEAAIEGATLELVGDFATINETMKEVGLDLRLNTETLEGRLIEIVDALGTGKIAEMAKELARLYAIRDTLVAEANALNASVEDVTARLAEAQQYLGDKTAAVTVAQTALQVAIESGDANRIAEAQDQLRQLEGEAAGARAYYSASKIKFDEVIGSARLTGQTLAKKIAESQAAIVQLGGDINAALDLQSTAFTTSIGDGLVALSGDLLEGLSGLSIDVGMFLGDAVEKVKLTIKDGQADLLVKIGENTLSLKSTIEILKKTLTGKLSDMGSGISTVAGNVMSVVTALGAAGVIALTIAEILGLTEEVEQFVRQLWEAVKAVGGIFQTIGEGILSAIEWLRQGIEGFFGWLFGAKQTAATLPTQYAGIVPGVVGTSCPAMAHGGGGFGAAGFAQVMDYGVIGTAVGDAVYGAMVDALKGMSSRPFIFNVDGRQMARGLFNPFLEENDRRGGVILTA